MPIVRTSAVLEVKLVGKALLGVILRPDIFLLVRTVGASALPRIVNPAHQVIVVRFFSHAREVRGEDSALHLVAFANRVAGQTSPRFKQFFAVRRVAGFVLGKWIGKP